MRVSLDPIHLRSAGESIVPDGIGTRLVRTDFGDTIEFFVHTDGCRPFSCPICDKGDCPVRQHPFDQKIEWTLENLLSNKKHRLETEPV